MFGTNFKSLQFIYLRFTTKTLNRIHWINDIDFFLPFFREFFPIIEKIIEYIDKMTSKIQSFTIKFSVNYSILQKPPIITIVSCTHFSAAIVNYTRFKFINYFYFYPSKVVFHKKIRVNFFYLFPICALYLQKPFFCGMILSTPKTQKTLN